MTELRNTPRSIGAVVLGFITVFMLSLGTDEILHLLSVYPPWGEPMQGAGLFVLATAYRTLYAIAGGYVAARFAPRAPVRHALILGIIGLVPSLGGVLASLGHPELGPIWYPVVLLVESVPCAWLGGVLFSRSAVNKAVAS